MPNCPFKEIVPISFYPQFTRTTQQKEGKHWRTSNHGTQIWGLIRGVPPPQPRNKLNASKKAERVQTGLELLRASAASVLQQQHPGRSHWEDRTASCWETWALGLLTVPFFKTTGWSPESQSTAQSLPSGSLRKKQTSEVEVDTGDFFFEGTDFRVLWGSDGILSAPCSTAHMC